MMKPIFYNLNIHFKGVFPKASFSHATCYFSQIQKILPVFTFECLQVLHKIKGSKQLNISDLYLIILSPHSI